MATFQIPQFIDQKPKIIGFLTLQQFFYLAGGGILSYIAFYLFTFAVWILLSIIIMSIAVSFAFVTIQGQSFPKIAAAVFRFLLHPRLYTWQRTSAEQTIDTSTIDRIERRRATMNVQEKLKSLALSVTTGSLFKQKDGESGAERYQVVRSIIGEEKLARRIDY